MDRIRSHSELAVQPVRSHFINIYLSFELTSFSPGTPAPSSVSVVCRFQMTVSTTPRGPHRLVGPTSSHNVPSQTPPFTPFASKCLYRDELCHNTSNVLPYQVWFHPRRRNIGVLGHRHPPVAVSPSALALNTWRRGPTGPTAGGRPPSIGPAPHGNSQKTTSSSYCHLAKHNHQQSSKFRESPVGPYSVFLSPLPRFSYISIPSSLNNFTVASVHNSKLSFFNQSIAR